ncbi:MAG: AI-2E family transporter [bacterium]
MISITDKKKLSQFIFLTFITGLMLYICWLMFAPFVSVILWSVILVIIFHPLYEKIFSKTKNHTISAFATIAVSLLTFIIPAFVIVTAAVNELSGISESAIPQIQQMMTDPEHSKFANVYNYINQFVNLKDLIKPEDIKAFLSKISSVMISASWSVIEGFFGVLIGILFAVFSMFYLLRDADKIVKDIPEILPFENSQAKELMSETSELISATIRGSLFIALIQGILAGIIFWILGIPSFVILGLLAMVFSLVPTGGTAFVTVPVIIILLASGEYGKAAILALYASVVIGMIDNFLLPKLIKQRVKINELYIFFSVIGGLQLFGIIGLFLGPIIFVIAIGLFKIFRGKKIDKGTISVS